MEQKLFCKSGGCTAKLGPGILSHVLTKIPKGVKDEKLLVGYDSNDDGAVYQLTEDIAIVQTLDFFPPMVENPHIFGQIAAANALSDIFAMGAEVKTALNIVCFPEKYDLNILGEIMRGGAEKVAEAGGTLVGGHSISDEEIKYGLSVTGVVHPKKIYANNEGVASDILILTKKLGVGIICTANRVGEASKEAMEEAILSMTTLNCYASRICRGYEIHACTDVTGFGLIGHLHEMLHSKITAVIYYDQVPVIRHVCDYADEFLLTGAGQRNRNQYENETVFSNVPFSMEEVLFDPQTSGGLLVAVKREQACALLEELRKEGLKAAIIGELIHRKEKSVYVKKKDGDIV